MTIRECVRFGFAVLAGVVLLSSGWVQILNSSGLPVPSESGMVEAGSLQNAQRSVLTTWEEEQLKKFEDHIAAARTALDERKPDEARARLALAEKIRLAAVVEAQAQRKIEEIKRLIEETEEMLLNEAILEEQARQEEERARQEAEKDDMSWELVLGIGSREAINKYLTDFPEGRHAIEARQRLKDIEAENQVLMQQAIQEETEMQPEPEEFPSDADVPKPGDTWRDSVTGMEFVWIPAGEFDMGSMTGSSDELPRRRVTIEGFWMGKYEVTQGQWTAVMGENPSVFQKGEKYPVETVSWEECQTFIQRLNQQTGQSFRLPTEAEWEYACRAETTEERYGEISDIAWYDENSAGSTQPVGLKNPNAFGLHDILGNVSEWCHDWYGPYKESETRKPTGPPEGSGKVLRGGSYADIALGVRAGARGNISPLLKYDDFGFRLVRVNQ